MRPAERRAAWCWVGACALVLVVVAVTLVPWDWTPGGAMPPVDPTAGLSPDVLARIDGYSGRAATYGLVATGVSLLVALVLALTPLGARLVARLPGGHGRAWPLQVLLAVLVLGVVGRLATLPLAIPAERLRRRYGLSTQTWWSWTTDRLTGLAVSVVVTTLLVLVVLALARRARRGWWAVAGLLAAGLVVAGSTVYPLVVEPLYNRFTAMPDGPLRDQLLGLADAEGLDVDEVLVADASRRTTAVNAYVSGLGATKRLVVYDTLLELPDPQVRQVVAHELGHATHHDVALGTGLGAVGAAGGVVVLVLVATAAPVRRRAGVGQLRDATAVPLLVGLAAVGTLVAAPAQNVVSRAIEARADRTSLQLTGDSQALVRLQQQLATRNLDDPDPPRWRYLWFDSHPTTAQRVALAETDFGTSDATGAAPGGGGDG